MERNVRLGANIHSPLDGPEIISMEEQALAHPAVKAELAKLNLPEGTQVIIDPWIYGMPIKVCSQNLTLISDRIRWRRR